MAVVSMFIVIKLCKLDIERTEGSLIRFSCLL